METRAAKVAACPCKEARSVFNLSPFSKDKLSRRALRVVTAKDVNPPTQVGSTSAKARKVKAASTRT
jgi:hypothetical protein